MLIGLSKNILPAHFYGDYKLDSNFVSCILFKFFNFCAQINDALTFNTEAKKTTIIILIGLSKEKFLGPSGEPLTWSSWV